jgi:hypothetical protein
VVFASIFKLLGNFVRERYQKVTGAPRAATTSGDLGVVLTLSG